MIRMRLHILILAVGYYSTSVLFAQTTIGFKGGPSYHTLKIRYASTVLLGSTVEPDPDERATGFGSHAGFYLNTTGQGSVGLLFEVLYSRRSASIDYDYSLDRFNAYKGRITYRLEYMEVPVLLNFKATDHFQVSLGAAALIAQVASFVDIGTYTYDSPPLEFTNTYVEGASITDGLTKVVADLAVGAQYEILNGLHCGLRYLIDLNDADNSDQAEARSTVLQFSVGYDVFGRLRD